MTPDPSQPTIQLDQFLKLMGAVQTGGEAKYLIQAGEVQVNDAIETRRKRKLHSGDRVEMAGQVWEVDLPPVD